VGLRPTPCKLFEKSLTKTLTGNARMRISKEKGLRGLVPLQGEGTASILGFGVKPQGLTIPLILHYNQNLYIILHIMYSGGCFICFAMS